LSNASILPPNEAARLAALRRYEILDTPPDGAFDRVTGIAADLFSVPIAIVSLVDTDRIWFKSHHGLDVQQIDRAPGLCASAILQNEPWLLADAKTDPRSLSNPLVAGEFGLRFYLGVPLQTHDGFNLGTLCVIGKEPRPVSDKQISQLKHLASLVIDQMELRLSARNAVSRLSEAVAQKDLMVKEVDHRVMNSLQLASSILALQSKTLTEAQGRESLTIASARISAIARVHQHVSRSHEIGKTNCRGYLERLCGDLSGSLAASIGVAAIDAELPTDMIVPLGLIVNELVTNAVKNGGKTIRVSFERSPSEGYTLLVEDDGKGLPGGFDPTVSSGLGMKVVLAMSKKINGSVVFGSNGDNGTRVKVMLPA